MGRCGCSEAGHGSEVAGLVTPERSPLGVPAGGALVAVRGQQTSREGGFAAQECSTSAMWTRSRHPARYQEHRAHKAEKTEQGSNHQGHCPKLTLDRPTVDQKEGEKEAGERAEDRAVQDQGLVEGDGHG